MRALFQSVLSSGGVAARRQLSSWRSNEQGSTAVEFGIVALPFILFCAGVMGYGLHIFSNSMLEQGVEAASRKIRTGEVNGLAMTQEQFKQSICDTTAGVIDCGKLTVHVQSGANWSDIVPTPCLDENDNMTAQGGVTTEPISNLSGGASQVVVVTACYEWVLAKSMPFLMLGNMDNGSALLQGVSTFRSEPYL